MLRKIDVPSPATGVGFRESRQEGSCSEDPGFIKANGVREACRGWRSLETQQCFYGKAQPALGYPSTSTSEVGCRARSRNFGSGAGERGPCCTHGDLSSIPKTSIKKQGLGVCTCNPTTEEGRDTKIPGAHGPVPWPTWCV